MNTTSPPPAPTPQDLKGKTAIVTGSSRGIGAGIAIGLAKRGANIVVNHISPTGEKAAVAVIKEIEAAGSKAKLVQANVAIVADLKKLVDAALEISETGKIDILVLNAGDGENSYLEDITEDFFQRVLDVNLKAPIFLTKLSLPYLARGGRIVIITSVASKMGIEKQTVYAATKAGLEGVAKVWARELGQKYGITVNCVAPGPVITDMYYSNPPEVIEAFKPIIEATPAAPRAGEVSDIVPIVLFLCSEESRWVTGSVVGASGGMVFVD